jgi:3-oxoacyl-[acyl-carrier-protein] synthase-3
VKRAVITGSGREIPPQKITNDALAQLQDTSDEWIQTRSGIRSRRYVDEGVATSDLGVGAARKAIEMSGLDKSELDLVVFATMTPDHYFPGAGVFLQHKLGLTDVPCFDIRQQCVGFIYGMQMVDAQIRAGMAKNVLLVGAEVHSGFLPYSRANWALLFGRSDTPATPEERAWNTRFRDRSVLFGDAGAAVVVQALDHEDRGVIDSILRSDGSESDKLIVHGVGFKYRPYVDAAQIERGDHIPVVLGRQVFKLATVRMAEVTQEILKRNDMTLDDVDMVLMHQANRRINDYVQSMLELPDDKVFHNIHKYGNTTAATIPLLWDECVREGRIQPGHVVLMVAFGGGVHWGATLLRA